METDGPHALREAILACRNGGAVSAVGVVGGLLLDKFPMGSRVNRSITLRAGRCHVQHYAKGGRLRAGGRPVTF